MSNITREKSGRRIVVSSNCQTGGLAAALQVLFPADEILPLALPSLSEQKNEFGFVEKIKSAHVWVSIGGHELLKKYDLDGRIELVRIPIIRFSGFHPDLVYARRASNNELISPHYNSAIAIWAYQRNLAVHETERLFNEENFRQLGYLDHWSSAIEELRQRFENSDLEFRDFILSMRREGLFMYSLNHPKAIALARLAKLIAEKIDPTSSYSNKFVDINDGLNHVIWPIYPGIGDSLSIHSSYDWKIDEGRWICGVRAFLEDAHRNYASQKILPTDIVGVGMNKERFDQVLGCHVSGGLGLG